MIKKPENNKPPFCFYCGKKMDVKHIEDWDRVAHAKCIKPNDCDDLEESWESL